MTKEDLYCQLDMTHHGRKHTGDRIDTQEHTGDRPSHATDRPTQRRQTNTRRQSITQETDENTGTDMEAAEHTEDRCGPSGRPVLALLGWP